MKIERRIGNKTVYLELFNGREIRATTAGGPEAAKKIFAIIRAQNGMARSPALPQSLQAHR